MFSSGILLASGIVHALPHASEMFEAMQSSSQEEHTDEVTVHEDDGHGHRHLQEAEHDEHAFPWANVIFGSTFMLFLIIEAFMERAIDNYLGGLDKVAVAGCHENKPKIEDGTEASTEPMQPIDECTDCDIAVNVDNVGCSLHRKPSQYLVSNKRPSVVGMVHIEAELENLDERQTINPWVAVLLLVVMSIHVILEGLALGSASDVSAITSLFISIVFHRGFGAFALGSSFVTSGYWDNSRPGGRRMFYIMTFVYIAMDIVGIAIGWGIGQTFDEESYGEAVINAMLGGSFLFVSAAELIPGQLEKTRVHKFPVVPVMLSMVVGFAAMSALGVVGH